MFALRCTVRNCHHLLLPKDAGLFCEAGHHFDRAKGGFWNLTQPQDKKSLNPGDSDDAVLARQRWIERGHIQGLVETIKPWLPTPDDSLAVLDLGCGEGSFGPALFSANAAGYCGIDLSRKAIKIAARRWPAATWVLANADRILPAADQSVDVVMSLFGRRPVSEIARVLKPQGICIVAVPGEADLIELREQVQQEGRSISRWQRVVDEFSTAQLTCDQRDCWVHQVVLDVDAIGDALAMTYRAVRHSQNKRLQDVSEKEVTLSADLMLFRKS